MVGERGLRWEKPSYGSYMEGDGREERSVDPSCTADLEMQGHTAGSQSQYRVLSVRLDDIDAVDDCVPLPFLFFRSLIRSAKVGDFLLSLSFSLLLDIHEFL